MCTPVEAPTNGFAVGESNIVESVVSFGCSEGYELSRNLMMMCLENGQWNDTVPDCLGKPTN